MTSCHVGGLGSGASPIQMYIQQAAQVTRAPSPAPVQAAPLPAGMGLKIDAFA